MRFDCRSLRELKEFCKEADEDGDRIKIIMEVVTGKEWVELTFIIVKDKFVFRDFTTIYR